MYLVDILTVDLGTGFGWSIGRFLIRILLAVSVVVSTAMLVGTSLI